MNFGGKPIIKETVTEDGKIRYELEAPTTPAEMVQQAMVSAVLVDEFEITNVYQATHFAAETGIMHGMKFEDAGLIAMDTFDHLVRQDIVTRDSEGNITRTAMGRTYGFILAGCLGLKQDGGAS